MINPGDTFLFTLKPQAFYKTCETISLLPSQNEQYLRLLMTFLEVVQHNLPRLSKPCWTICCNYWVMRRCTPPALEGAYKAERKKADVIFLELSVKVVLNYQAAIGRYQNPQKGKHLLENIAFLRRLLPASLDGS